MDELTPKLKSNFEEHKDLLNVSKDLATIKTDLDLEIPSTNLSETIFLDDKVLEDSGNEISKY